MEPGEIGSQKEVDFSNVEYVISDWDGTLVDSMPAYTASFTQTLHSGYGINKKTLREFYKSTAGAALSYQIKEAARKFANVTIEDTTELEEIFWDNLKGLRPRILPGAKEFLATLKQKGLRIVIWSGTRTDILGEKIELLSFSSLVDFHIGNVPGDDRLVKGKGLFEKIADHFGLPAQQLSSQTLVIGDGKADVDAGREVDAKTAGFGKTDEPKLRDADFIFEDYTSLLSKF